MRNERPDWNLVWGYAFLLLLLSCQGQKPETPSPVGDTNTRGPALGGGSEVGNGGDPWSIDFVTFAHRVADEISKMPVEHRHGIDPVELLRVIETTKVESTPEILYLEGIQKTALNFPGQKRILLSRPAWESEKNMVLKRKFALHEFSEFIGISDNNYQVSAKIYSNPRFGINPCDGSETELREKAIALFNKRGHVIKFNNLDTGNSTDTLAGGHIRVLRGYEVEPGGRTNALMTIAECDPSTGKYLMLANSGSGAGIKAICPGSHAAYCGSE